MSIASLTVESLGAMLGREVPDAHLLVAKNSVLGLDAPAIAELLGVEVGEVKELEESEDYKEVRLLIAARYNESGVETDLTWDDIENRALKNIAKRIDYEKDLEKNLRIAAVANRATRRHQSPTNRVLDAAAAGRSVKLTLTNRMIQRLSGGGEIEHSQTQQVSIKGGSASNPTFAEIDEHLGVTARPRIPSNLSFTTQQPEITDDIVSQELSKALKK